MWSCSSLRSPASSWPGSPPGPDSHTCVGHSWDCSLKQLGFSSLHQTIPDGVSGGWRSPHSSGHLEPLSEQRGGEGRGPPPSAHYLKRWSQIQRGVKAIAEFLAQSNTDEPLEAAWALLESLSRGNPRYQNQVYKALIALMTCSSPKAQQRVLHSLHTVQSKMKTAHHSIVEPLLGLLSSLHLEVQDEAINLILGLRCYEVRPLLLDGLVALLRPTKENVQHQNMQESEIIQMTGSLPVFVQQAAAAKSIRLLAEDSQEVSRELLSLGVIQRLLYAMGNREHTDAQIQASLALKHFVRSFPNIEEHVQRGIGSTLFAAFMNQADTLYMNMDETQAEILLTNKVNITEVWYGDNSEG
ncbi:armadillo-like helical domain containing protein 1 isoform X2 [Gymnodraco acuticeps]|uniref:Armadillo-like helical domain containing protein 1 isoform X2 n=1 Tax=Gymnodraco acuticeps TaxID=8218 RepID=A0A6P8USB7_GYMAC|nr:armadillo-like helical domain containing protein 1 isoform X2 [Gymnodraco acuticeps]